jgi:hypothetical protein
MVTIRLVHCCRSRCRSTPPPPPSHARTHVRAHTRMNPSRFEGARCAADVVLSGRDADGLRPAGHPRERQIHGEQLQRSDARLTAPHARASPRASASASPSIHAAPRPPPKFARLLARAGPGLPGRAGLTRPALAAVGRAVSAGGQPLQPGGEPARLAALARAAARLVFARTHVFARACACKRTHARTRTHRGACARARTNAIARARTRKNSRTGKLEARAGARACGAHPRIHAHARACLRIGKHGCARVHAHSSGTRPV